MEGAILNVSMVQLEKSNISLENRGKENES